MVTDRNDKFPYPFIYFNWWNPTLSCTRSLKKVPHFGSTHGFILLPSPLYVSIFVPFRAPLYVSIFAPFRLKKREKNSSGGSRAPLIFGPNKLRPEGPKKFLWESAFPPPPPPYLRVWMTPPPPPFISRSGSGSSCGLIQDGLFTNWKLGFDSDLRLHDFNLLVLETSD